MSVRGAVVTKPAARVTAADDIHVSDPLAGFVGRGAGKLLAALDAFAIPVAERTALDAGASTGGFTQVLLGRGAQSVFAVDVGHGQLDPELAADPRVMVFEGTDIRDARRAGVPQGLDIVVADLSFISLVQVVPALSDLAAPRADMVLLVKPQFEAGRAALDGRGVVRSATARADAVVAVGAALEGLGWTIRGALASPVIGGAGNSEYLLWSTPGASTGLTLSDLHDVVIGDDGSADLPGATDVDVDRAPSGRGFEGQAPEGRAPEGQQKEGGDGRRPR